MRFLLVLFQAITIPVVIINTLGGLVAIIWLMVLGEWGTLGYGLLYLVGSTFLIGLALMPGILLATPALWALEKGRNAWNSFGPNSNSVYVCSNDRMGRFFFCHLHKEN